MYEKGEGVAQNSSEALVWYKRAGRHGDRQATEAIPTLEAKVQSGGSTDPKLDVFVSGSTRTIMLADLKQHLQPVQLTVVNPAYEHTMTYEGFWLDDLLKYLEVKLGQEDIVFQCADGYGSSLFADEVGKKQWLLAYGEPHGWTPLPDHTPDLQPGPWYLIGRDPASFKKTPWPYQVVGIKIRCDW